ncbi:alpha/beta hydrolase [Hymenobacter sp. GOD-10R]|uniref:RBBP9/YdeN family alpha/beta hydrolase n=1 Tax=Hymenobacter sp. GOD-10R TaxID=3093922 RepID=UPI002D77A89A|nr:alpha/beta hydrolase [Hymenobacter sp. GOD-10R]WRQ27553.1 alpha/beta hydrolase [Hymenobacter sp. GOD-10R]
MKLTILLVPGLGNSGPQHWQSIWATLYHHPRVEQQEWDHPRCADWVQGLNEAIQRAESPVVLVAHSLACSTIGHWAHQYPTEAVVGALLVAPADTERPDFPAEATGFAPMPQQRLPFASLVVASTNDEYVSIARAQAFAAAWGSEFVDVGAQGHLNVASNLGNWPTGYALLQKLLQQV